MIKYSIKLIAFSLLLAVLFIPESGFAQDLHPSRRASPMGMARGFAGDVYVKITFSQPYKRGRDNIFGSGADVMHPNGKIWRFGANEPTEITVDGPVTIGGERVEAGTYSIFSMPGADKWTLYINSLKGGGANQYSVDKNVATIMVDVTKADEEADQFTIRLDEQDDKSLHMVTSWIDWELHVPIKAAM